MEKYAAWCNLNVLELAGFFTVVMMMHALEHGPFKSLSGFAMHTQAWCPNTVL